MIRKIPTNKIYKYEKTPTKETYIRGQWPIYIKKNLQQRSKYSKQDLRKETHKKDLRVCRKSPTNKIYKYEKRPTKEAYIHGR